MREIFHTDRVEAILIQDKKFLILRSKIDGWVFPRGEKKTGENSDQAIVRQVLEQTGFYCREYELLAELDPKEKNQWNVNREMFLVKSFSGKKRNFSPENIGSMRWATVSEVCEKLSLQDRLPRKRLNKLLKEK